MISPLNGIHQIRIKLDAYTRGKFFGEFGTPPKVNAKWEFKILIPPEFSQHFKIFIFTRVLRRSPPSDRVAEF